MSTATDVYAPATQQGAGLLNVAAAVRLARSIGNGSRDGGLLLSPGQVNVTQNPGATTTQTISVTNTSSHGVRVHLATRALTSQVVGPDRLVLPAAGNAHRDLPGQHRQFRDLERRDRGASRSSTSRSRARAGYRG